MRKLVNARGFTIVELTTIIAIILILTSFLLAGVFKAVTLAEIRRARATIEQLEAALEMYSQNWGTYPNDDGSYPFTGCSKLINALESETTQAKKRGGPYVKYPAKLKDGSGNLIDPFGNPYRYHWNTTTYNVTAIGQINGQPNITYNIWSYGPDGIEADVPNPNYPLPPSLEVQKRYGDDIVNW